MPPGGNQVHRREFLFCQTALVGVVPFEKDSPGPHGVSKIYLLTLAAAQGDTRYSKKRVLFGKLPSVRLVSESDQKLSRGPSD